MFHCECHDQNIPISLDRSLMPEKRARQNCHQIELTTGSQFWIGKVESSGLCWCTCVTLLVEYYYTFSISWRSDCLVTIVLQMTHEKTYLIQTGHHSWRNQLISQP